MMSQFSAGDAAIHGFKAVSRAPAAVIGAIALYAVFYTAYLQLFLPTYIEMVTAGAMSDPAASQEMMQQILRQQAYSGLLSLVSIALGAIVMAGILRPLTGRASGPLGLGLGMDELRMLALFVLLYAVVIVFTLIVSILAAILAVPVMLAAGGGGEPGAGVTILVVLMIMAIIFTPLIYFGVRFSPMFAATIGEQRFFVLDAWCLTRRRFWPIFGAFVLAFFISLICSLVGFALVFAITAAVGFETIVQQGLSLPISVIAAALLSAIVLIGYLPYFGVGAYVYLHAKGESGLSL